ncbi:MAG TPA: hypothetical protein VGO83_05835, partial [Thermoleophilaceae bacterium]|nr:hypothetical protein [Thermoleophilaceae bacterium]
MAALAQADSETGAASPESSRPGIASLVGALSEPRTDEDVVPADAAAQAEGAGPAGIAVKESVLATTGSGGWVLYLIPATNEVCVSLVDPLGGSSLSCKTAEA